MTPYRERCLRPTTATLALGLLLLGGCVTAPPPAAGIGAALAWSELPGWQTERHAEAWPALIASCTKMPARDVRWHALCEDAALYPNASDDIARAFFETRFRPHVVHNDRGASRGLVTGYYEPLLNGSRTRTGRYRYPVYRRPDDLLVVDLASLYPDLAGRKLRGRLQGNRVVPYLSRGEIGGAQGGPDGAHPTNGTVPLAGHELLWVDDPVDLFFLQVQGSGRVRLTDGTVLHVGYADQNGHPYQSIGARLIEMGELARADVNLDSIRAWLAANPDKAEDLLNSNPSYVFFAVRESTLPGPLGALNVPLTAERSAAVDPAFIPLGSPLWLDTTVTDATACAAPACAPATYRRLLMAQDTGGAIKGPVRIDVFFGFGPTAERLAGNMKQAGRLFVLMPAPR